MARQTGGPTSERRSRKPGRASELPQGVVTFLCTDIEGSSPLWEQHQAAMNAALTRHEATISTVVTAHGGRLIKSRGEGDSTLSVFRRASEAVTAALALQQALEEEVWPDGLTLPTRVALHTGEAELRDGDYYGPTLNRAARLRALAQGGQVLLSGVTAELVADQLPAGAGLADVGMQHLKGLSRAERVVALVHPDLRAPSVALSRPTTRSLGGTFVGRDVELSQLGDALDSALGGQGRLVLVTGEAGIGKTRITEELANKATARGVKVLWGRCSESEGSSAYWPWIQVLRAGTADRPPEALSAQLGQDLAAVAQLLPELAEAPPSSVPTVQEPETARLHLYQAVSDFLRRASRSTALLVVLDDLHWADRASLALLEFVTRGLAGSRLLLVATYRDVEVHRQHPLSDSLAELVRQPVTSRVILRGLKPDHVRRCIVAIGGTEPRPDLVTAVYDRTEGNPFFVGELVRLLAAEGRLDRSGLLITGVPEGVRQVIGRRLNRLSEATIRILTVASVQGRDFDLDVVAYAVDLGGEEVLDRLEEAINAHLVVEAGGSWGRYRFTHALVRETLYDEPIALQRRRLHQRIGQALTELRAGRLEAHLAELAHHWYAAGDLDRALPTAIEAGIQAERAYAFAEADEYYQRALDLWARVPRAAELAPVDQVALLQRAAEAAYLTGDDLRALELLRAALNNVDRQRDPVRAALVLDRLGRLLSLAWPTADQAAMAAYEEAVRLVRAEPPSAEQARVLAGYGYLLLGYISRYEDARRVSEQALTAARRVGARQEEGRALACLGAASGFLGDLDEGLAHLLDARRIAEEEADVDGLGLACGMLHDVNESAGRLNDALAAALDGAEATRRLGSPRWSNGFQGIAANFAFRLGRWEEADRLFRALLERRPLTPFVEAYVRLERARLDIARGDVADMRRWLQEAEELARKAGRARFDERWGPMLAHAQAALALLQGSDEEAFEAATEGLGAKARAGDAAGWPELFALGMAAAAARAERARTHHAAAEAEAARRDGTALLARLETLADRAAPASPELAAVVVQCRAEQTRLHGRADPARWAAAAARWEALSQPYATTYARFREAEALLAGRAPRAQVAAVLRAAHALAVRLGAAPLRRDLERLAQRGRIRLQAPALPAQQ